MIILEDVHFAYDGLYTALQGPKTDNLEEVKNFFSH